MADKEEIKDRSDIVEVIQTYVPLKHRGRNYLGLCPFHQEKTPSFNVTPSARAFKCFGCGVSGDVFTFIEKYNNMTFIEAADFLARRAGLTFDRIGGEGEHASERDQLFKINSVALTFFRSRLDKAQTAKEYVQSRGLAFETIRAFQIGYAPPGWNNLSGYLQNSRHDMEAAASAGLIQKGKTEDYFDVFRHRIMFPILDEQERIVGFGGRAFGDDQPKYLNTGETRIFNKSRLLYGLPLARRKISTESRVLLMEGYMDVIAAHQAGFTNAVATLGTSLTKDHARKLSQLAPSIALVYDGDNAGIKATLRAAEVFKEVQDEGAREVDLRMVRLPDGEDPDSVLKRGDVALFQRAIDDAGGYVDFLIDAAKRRQNLGTAEGRAKFLSDLSRILADVPAMEICDRYLTEYANLHPEAKYSLESAVKVMRDELRDRRQNLLRLKRSKQAQAKREGAKAAAQANPQTPESVLPVVQANPPVAAAAPAAPLPANRYQPLSREERAQRDRKRYLQQVRPIRESQPVITAADRAEQEILRAMLEPEWRSIVIKHVAPDDLLMEHTRRLFEIIRDNLDRLDSYDSSAASLLSLVKERESAEFSAALESLAQDISLQMANVPITQESIAKAAQTLRRNNKLIRSRQVEEALSALLQASPASVDDQRLVRDYTQELQQILRELKGSE